MSERKKNQIHLNYCYPLDGSIYLEVPQSGWINQRCSINKGRRQLISSFACPDLLANAGNILQLNLKQSIFSTKVRLKSTLLV